MAELLHQVTADHLLGDDGGLKVHRDEELEHKVGLVLGQVHVRASVRAETGDDGNLNTD